MYLDLIKHLYSDGHITAEEASKLTSKKLFEVPPPPTTPTIPSPTVASDTASTAPAMTSAFNLDNLSAVLKDFSSALKGAKTGISTADVSTADVSTAGVNSTGVSTNGVNTNGVSIAGVSTTVQQMSLSSGLVSLPQKSVSPVSYNEFMAGSKPTVTVADSQPSISVTPNIPVVSSTMTFPSSTSMESRPADSVTTISTATVTSKPALKASEQKVVVTTSSDSQLGGPAIGDDPKSDPSCDNATNGMVYYIC